MAMDRSDSLRQLPSIERLASAVDGPPGLTVRAARQVVAEARERILAGMQSELSEARLATQVAELTEMLGRSSIRRVVNATGVILHTNLGRAPLAPAAARAAMDVSTGYSNLEYDLSRGERGSRHAHLEDLLIELSGAEAAITVNNNAAAVLLALAATAAGREVITGRDSLIEIGDSFRIPEILAQSGAELIEVGTTNRTRVGDFEAAIGERTAALLHVHQSNFRSVGFSESAPIADVGALGQKRGLQVIDDLGSGALEPISDEPLLSASIAAGATLVCCSADKLLGGPQAGVIAGTTEAVERCRRHPLARALRLDKLQIAALEVTLRLHRDAGPEAIPVLAMLAAGRGELLTRAQAMADAIGAAGRVIESTSRPGGGTLPTTELAGPACAVEPGADGGDALLAAICANDPPVIARIDAGRVLLDPRTMNDAEARIAAEAVVAALG